MIFTSGPFSFCSRDGITSLYERMVISMVAYKIILLILIGLTFGPLLTEKKGDKTFKKQLGTVSGVLMIITLIIGWIIY